jgi:MFS family permease
MTSSRVAHRFRATFRAFRWRNYRLFAGGQAISLVGTWMQRIAVNWLVYQMYRKGGAAWHLGAINFVSMAPNFFLGPLAGLVADRHDRFRIVLWMQVAQMFQALVLWGVVMGGQVQFWHLVALSLLLGITSAFETPARQAFIVRMVGDRADLGNAIALNSSIFNGARLVGPALAGTLVAWLGAGPVFLINGASYLAVIWALLAMRLDPEAGPAAAKADAAGFWRRLSHGFRRVFGEPALRVILVNLGLMGIIGMPFTVLVPIVADGVFHGGANAYGWMMGVSGAGALAGGIWLAGRTRTAGLNRVVANFSIVFAASLMLLGVASVMALGVAWDFRLALAAMFLSGMGALLQMAGSNTMLQALVREDQRGTVMSYFSMAAMGTFPFGSLAVGWVAEWIGVQGTLIACGAACLGIALWLRPKFLRLRLPEASGAPGTRNLARAEKA